MIPGEVDRLRRSQEIPETVAAIGLALLVLGILVAGFIYAVIIALSYGV